MTICVLILVTAFIGFVTWCSAASAKRALHGLEAHVQSADIRRKPHAAERRGGWREASDEGDREGRVAGKPNVHLVISHRCGAIGSDACPGFRRRFHAGGDCDSGAAGDRPARWHAARDRALRLCCRIARVRRLRGQPLHVGRSELHHRADFRRRCLLRWLSWAPHMASW